MTDKQDMKLSGRLNVKIFGIIITITTAVSFIIAYFLYSYFYGIEVERALNVQQMEFNNYMDEINKVYLDAQRLQQRMAIEEELQAYLDMPEERLTEAEENIMVRDIVSTLSRTMMQYEFISSIALIKNGEIAGWTEAAFFDEVSKEIRESWYEEFLKSVNQTDAVISKPYAYSLQQPKSTKMLSLISIHIPVYSIKKAYASYGSLIINIETDSLKKILENGNGFSGALLEQGDGSLVVSMGNTKGFELTGRSSDAFPLVFTGKTQLGLVLKALYEKPPSFQMSGKDTMKLTAVMLAALPGIILLLGITMLYLLRPIKTLLTAMDGIGKGNLDIRVKVRTGDEFELLGSHLNGMAEKLNENFHDRLRAEKERHDMEYSLLAAQINPHFIYNTLNTVIYLAGRDRTQDVVKITKALIELLQGGIKLSGDRNLSTVDEELAVLRNYVLIQNYRYSGKFQLVIECDDHIRKREIPSSILQPFLENALFHGIVPLKRTGTVTLTIKRADKNGVEGLEICLADDGVGMPEEKIKLLLSGGDKHKENGRNHIGIHNVVSRLKLLYKDTYRFSLSSEEGKGTRLIIYLPYLESD